MITTKGSGSARRIGEEEAVRRRGAIMAEHWGYQLADERKLVAYAAAASLASALALGASLILAS